MMNILSKRNWRVAAVVLCGLGVVKVIQAFNPQPDPPAFALAGMNPGDEYMRLNVSNLPISGISFGGSCDVELLFSDDQGHALKRSLTTLALGQSTHLDLTRADLAVGSVPSDPSRVEILPSLVRGGFCVLMPSVEVIGTATGHTDAYVVRAGIPDNHNETLVRDTESGQ